jgi:integral membrane protein
VSERAGERVTEPAPRSGAHQVLLLLYALFTVAAGARSLVQLATRADEAPVAYTLSLLAAVTYALGWVAIRQASAGRTAFASRMLWVELMGVLTVGTLSLVVPEWFPDATVWSDFGIGYGFVPVALPIAGLLWLRAQDPERVSGDGVVTAFRFVAVAEAVSWFGLLVGMFFKYVVDAGEGGVKVFGPIHGTVFVSYVVIALITWRHQRWSMPVGPLAMAASVPPFCTVLFEVWASRSGRLSPSADRRPLIARGP